MSSDDWRVRITLSGEGVLERLLDGLREPEVEQEARAEVPAGVLVSQDGDELFAYGPTRADTEAAAAILRRVAAHHELSAGEAVLERWHPVEERWEAADVPLPDGAAAVEQEQELRADDERADSRAQPVPEWEIDVQLPSRADAVAFAEQLVAQGVVHRRTWATVKIPAETEADAASLAAGLRGAAPEGTEVSEPLGSQAKAWAAVHPFTWMGGLGS